MTNNLSENKNKTKQKKGIIGICIGVVIIAIIAIFAFRTSSTTINLNDYLVYETSGYDGYGVCDINVNWDAITNEYSDKLSYTSKAKEAYGELLETVNIIDFIINNAEITQDSYNNLHNNDVVSYTWNVNSEEIESLINCELKYSNGNYKISGLEEGNVIDLFNGIDNSLIKFEGPNGNTKAVFNNELEDGVEINRSNDFIAVLKDNYGEKIIEIIKDNQRLASLYFKIDKNQKLSNGDVINVSLSDPLALIDFGYLPEKDHITFEVSDRPELIASMTKEEAGVIEEYLSEKIQANNSENYTYSNANIHRVYFGKAKETTVTDYPYVILVDYSYSYDYSSRYYSNHQDYDNYAIFYDAYKDGENIVFEKENIGNSYSNWGYKTIEEVMENLQGDYDIEIIWE